MFDAQCLLSGLLLTSLIMFNPHPKMLTESETVGFGAALLLLPIVVLLSKELYSAEAR